MLRIEVADTSTVYQPFEPYSDLHTNSVPDSHPIEAELCEVSSK